MNEQSTPTRDDFLKWRSPVRGTQNPERMANPFWTWCVRSRDAAYDANKKFAGPDSISDGPCWCFMRMGQAHIALPDGRDVYIAGEHEDFYDPDFYIYNDVVIIEGDQIHILGYPKTVFPPTDFHSATLVESDIVLVGNLGYSGDRRPENTQVLRLNVETWQISPVQTTGTLPGWIHDHRAVYARSENAIIVSGGKLCGERILENFDDYKLCLKTLTWTKLTDRRWRRWILEREDGDLNKLWEIRNASWLRNPGIQEDTSSKFSTDFADLIAESRSEASDDQVRQIKTLYQSPFTNDIATEDDEQCGRYRMNIQGTTVRFDEDMYNIVVTVEGDLPLKTIDTILSSLQTRLSDLENTTYTVIQIDV